MTSICLDDVARVLSQHTGHYRRRPPVYQATMLADLAAVWRGPHDSVLDIGGGTGVIAEAMQALLSVGRVVAIDVVDRYFPTLAVETRVYDGVTLPFADSSFDAATINNVMHHVPQAVRTELMREIARVVRGPIYIKDHLPTGRLDDLRLILLDAIGNIPFGGQVDASYLRCNEWEGLAEAARRRIAETRSGTYRTGVMALVFPNRLEVTYRLDPE
jgi:ubiquinone/menaquinone biosynthesis C-methylase UbiE